MEKASEPAVDLRGCTVCLTGPESTGKTTLAAALAARLDGLLVPEVARQYLSGSDGYGERDLLEIARRQVAAEASARVTTAGLVVCDTDLLVIRVWWEEKFGQLPDTLSHDLAQREPRVYLLAAPDLPWQPDPLRENPHDRHRLFERYRTLLDAEGFPYGVVAGQGEDRLHSALNVIADVAGADALSR